LLRFVGNFVFNKIISSIGFYLKKSRFIHYLARYFQIESISMKKNYLVLVLFFNVLVAYSQKIPSPAEFLGYPLGEKFTYHHRAVAYYEAVAQASNRVKLLPYGKTYEGRPLLVAFVSSPENLQNLEQIRRNNMITTGLEKGNIEGKTLPIIWLSYNVHGNEASGMEAALATLYELASSQGDNVKNWLNEMLIVLDPCINPDGRDRYANWYNQKMGFPFNYERESWEHQEPWPGGRFNHYLFDLNRDWAWQTQTESQQRLQLYNQWLPQVHCDFHEMGYESPYYFAPAAKPYYEDISEWQREFQVLLGRNHAKYFDKEGWLYFTKETYDLFYPSYGDTYPTFSGAVGFTYEQGGSGRAGVGIIRAKGDTLTLKDRYTHHHVVGLSTIEISYIQRAKLQAEFKKFFNEGINNPKGIYKSYVIKKTNDVAKIKSLLALLDKQKIQYGHPSTAGALRGFEYLKNQEGSSSLDKEDIVISAYQPKAVLTKALFDPKPKLEDSLTYDLTAWALPYAYELESFAVRERINVSSEPVSFKIETPEKISQPYAYLVEWNDFQDAQFLAGLFKQGFKIKVAPEPFQLQKRTFKRGTLVITRGDNKALGNNFDNLIQNWASQSQQILIPAATGFVDEGKDFGSGDLPLLKAPKVALVLGEDVSATEGGAVWYFMEQELKYPATVLSSNSLNNTDLKKYDVIILAAGNYNSLSNTLINYASGGGKVIALEDAVEVFAKDSRTNLNKSLGKAEGEEKKDNTDAKSPKWLKKYADRERAELSENVAGAIYQIELDETHPLAFGEDKTTHIIKGNRTVYPYLQGGWNVGVFKNEAWVGGFVGSKLKNKLKNSLAIGLENYGRGKLIYFADTPIFRGFWHSGKLLLSNAIFLLD
jgi:hypothetical protein